MINNLVKYPRTYHLKVSPGSTNDDKKLESEDHLIGKEVLITLKLDGESCSMTYDKIWARSLDSRDHVSRNWVQSLWNTLKYDIPSDLRICGESLYAKHAIYYPELPSYFMCFNIWRGDECLSWDDTVEWCSLLDLKMVPVLYRGTYDEKLIVEIATDKTPIFGGEREGIVGRFPHSFKYEDFPLNTFKYVRKGHVQPNSKHWFNSEITPNKMVYV